MASPRRGASGPLPSLPDGAARPPLRRALTEQRWGGAAAARTLRRTLTESQGPDERVGAAPRSSTSKLADAPPQVSLNALDGHSCATRDIGVAVRKQSMQFQRCLSWHGAETTEPTVSSIAQPGGFRRLFVLGQEVDSPLSPTNAQKRYAERTSLVQQLISLEAYFAKAVDYLGCDDEFGIHMDPRLASPLLFGGVTVPAKGISSERQLVFVVLKSFVASAIMYLPRVWVNGGLAAAPIILCTTCSMSILCCRKLVSCADVMIQSNGGGHVPSYGDISRVALGEVGFAMVNGSLVISQLAFCATFVVLVYQNLWQVLSTLLGSSSVPDKALFMGAIAAVWTPLTWIRRMKYFAVPSFFGSLCMLAALVAILGFAGMQLLSESPVEPIRWVNLDGMALAVGTCAYTFEGIGIVIPLYDGTSPELRPRFKTVLTRTLVGVCVFYVLFSTVVYSAYTASTQMCVLLNMPTGSTLKAIVQLLFCFNLSVSFPLCMTPAIGILQNRFISGVGKTSTWAKAGKNVFRTSLVLFTTLVACFCEAELNNFVALIGGFCCMPLAVIYPAMMHHKLVGGQRAIDSLLTIVGCALGLLAVYTAITTWGS